MTPIGELRRNLLYDPPPSRSRREHQRLCERRLDDIAKLHPVSVTSVRLASLVARSFAVAADRFAPLAVRPPTLVIRFALVDSPTEKANAS